MIGWVFVLFIVSGWMFGMGVMVGRGTAPVHFDVDQLKRTIEGLQKAARDPQRSGGPVESTEMKDKTKLDFYDMLPKNREDLGPAEPAQAGPAAGADSASGAGAEGARAPRPEDTGRTPGPADPPRWRLLRPPTPPPAAASTGKGFTVQVSAVKSEEEARRTLERLRQRGYAGYLEPITTPDKGTLYRVRMGEFPSKEFARSTLDRLQKDGFEPQVVPK